MPAVVCPFCKADLKVDEQLIGKTVRCGRCKESFQAEDIPEIPDTQSQSVYAGCLILVAVVILISAICKLFGLK